MVLLRATLAFLIDLVTLVKPSQTTTLAFVPSNAHRQFLQVASKNRDVPTIVTHQWNQPHDSSPNPPQPHHQQQQQDPESSWLNFEDALYLERFKRRRDESISKNLSPHLPFANTTDPQDVISTLLDSFLRPHFPTPYFGYQLLYDTSTEKWRDVLRRSVGVASSSSNTTNDALLFRALSAFMEREDTQFGILVGMGVDDGSIVVDSCWKDDNTNNNNKEEYYTIEFPFDTLDYDDGTAWLECRLRNAQSDALLVVLGWSLCRGEDDGIWLVDGMEWQDFREKYRPGIGREMWERICG
ncbi:hypothetical protein HJC23_013581 [Cyclotella cryptica]|uniref:Uncharacterized protein n=1 Tax=Cyclotella cryptica TaxID=29204 RepID=A0ABD3PS37_9STRA|eukprot:CCRYP_012291-RA/>CCRYP_012291-RA protein AED:0.20 eAED:-0.32 QI:0/-1/0/1/-1/1/1/0/297